MNLYRLILFPAIFLVAAARAPQPGGFIYMDGESFPPADTHEKAEWTFARFHYDLGYQYGRFGFERWAADYPKADRQFIPGVRRLTRLEARSTEQIVDANSDDLFDWPWIYIEDPGGWRTQQSQATRLRQYLLRGGFLMADDSHGDYEWQVLRQGMHMIFRTVRSKITQRRRNFSRRLISMTGSKFLARVTFGGAVGPSVPTKPSTMARHPRRQGPRHGCHLPQFRRWRCMGMG